MRLRRKTRAALLFAVCVFPFVLQGQITGDIEIRVSDPTHSSIPEARVGIRNQEMQSTRLTSS
ncbi:MAG: hypothetical protein ABI822_03105, partial [Bryobacteraceae bacterium]